MLFVEKSPGKIKGLINTGCDVLIREYEKDGVLYMYSHPRHMVAAKKGVICTCNVTTRKSLFDQTLENN